MSRRAAEEAIVAALGPHYARRFIHDSYACLPGRGPLRALLRHLGWMRRHSYRLHLDIARYFPSVHHETLLERVLFPRLRDAHTRALLATLITHGGSVYRTTLAQAVLATATRFPRWVAVCPSARH